MDSADTAKEQVDSGVDRRRPSIRYVPALDGVRGIAVAAVFVFHAGQLVGGYLGVDMFFVLSGYLITSLLLVEGEHSGRIDLVRFWGRRARRLVPALAVMLTGVAAYAAFVAEPEELHRIRWDAVATMLYVANWREVFAHADYWALFTSPSPLDHTWSLAIEEQFYAIWPLVVVFAGYVALWAHRRRRGARGDYDRSRLAPTLLVVIGVLLVVSLSLQAWFLRAGQWNRVYYGTDTRASALLAGAVVAALYAWKGPVGRGMPRRVLEWVGITAAVFLAAAWIWMARDSILARHGGFAVCAVLAALVVTTVSDPDPGPMARVFAFRPFRGFGLISYGVYLFHWPIMVWLSPDRLGMAKLPAFVVQVTITTVLGYVSYRFIEQPIRRGPRWSRGRVLVAPAASFAAVGLLVFASTATSALDTVDVSDAGLTRAAKETANFDGDTVMVIGDSVGFHLARDGFAKVADPEHTRVVDAAVPGCQYPPARLVIGWGGKPVPPTGPVTCDRGWSKTARAYRPDYVIYARSGLAPFRFPIDGGYHAPCTPVFQKHYLDLLQADVDEFARLGATTVLVTNLPAAIDRQKDPKAFDDFVRVAACGNQVLHDIARDNPEHVRLVDLHAELCPAPDKCREEWQGVVLRPDQTHFKGPAARIVARWVFDQMGIETTRTGGS